MRFAAPRMPLRPAACLRLLAGLIGLVVLAPAGTAPASAAVKMPAYLSVGIADQKTEMFSDPFFADLHIRKVRRVVPWDTMHVGYEKAEVDAWIAAAQAAGTRPLITFGRSRQEGKHRFLPTPKRFQIEFRKFLRRYPDVKEYATWNEANYCGEPLCHKPKLAARYYDAMVRACPKCTILGAELLDDASMAKWVRSFEHRAKHRVRIWGLHNYLDANRGRTSGTRALLEAVKGDIWFTETGGIVKRRTKHNHGGFPENEKHAALSTRRIFDRLALLSKRIRRVYLYHWNPGGPKDSWDSALLDLDGQPRTSWRVVRNRIDRIFDARRAARKHAADKKAARRR